VTEQEETEEVRDALEREEGAVAESPSPDPGVLGVLEPTDRTEPDEAEMDFADAPDVAEPAEVVATEPALPAEGSGEPPSPDGESAPGVPGRKRWFVVHTYSGHENKVKANMERAIHYARMQERFGEILVATEDYAVMKAGKKQITKRKTFPSYVLVEMEMDDESRALVQNIPGVTHFVGDKNPTALTEAEVRRIRGEEIREVGKVTTEVPFKIGESVKVTQGPFADFVGSVDEINLERGKLRVMVSIFGRATAVELDLTHVTSI
jgi:transcriptional antiterminator NusG